MRVNVDKVLERDQKLSELDDRADALQAGASQFETSAAKLKNKYWWKNAKVRTCLNSNSKHMCIKAPSDYPTERKPKRKASKNVWLVTVDSLLGKLNFFGTSISLCHLLVRNSTYTI